jgi:hypothetical protein
MVPQIKKAKTAFLYFQGAKLSSIKKELSLSMGEAMTEVSKADPQLTQLSAILNAQCSK